MVISSFVLVEKTSQQLTWMHTLVVVSSLKLLLVYGKDLWDGQCGLRENSMTAKIVCDITPNPKCSFSTAIFLNVLVK